ncbi:hypothetical protein J6590_070288 [Homalodisca vitripennis]|nr:hypothetical protein J6590_070288 [Homalodisca vitripennis]
MKIDLYKNNIATDTYLNSLLGSGLEQCIDKPTWVSKISSTCIEHIFVRYRDMSKVWLAVIEASVTDHYSSALTITGHTHTTTQKA